MSNPVSRRDFGKFASAAFAGVMAGSLITGCGPGAKDGKEPVANKDKDGKDKVAEAGKEQHACRGLNTCKGNGAGGDNACAGQGECATVKHHSCAGQNECKDLGGCGETPAANACKGQGGCQVPMVHGNAWDRARATFESRMKGQNKNLGPAPAKK